MVMAGSPQTLTMEDHGRVLALLAVVAVGIAGPLGGRPAVVAVGGPGKPAHRAGRLGQGGHQHQVPLRVLGDGVVLELAQEGKRFVQFGGAPLLGPPTERPGQRREQGFAVRD